MTVVFWIFALIGAACCLSFAVLMLWVAAAEWKRGGT